MKIAVLAVGWLLHVSTFQYSEISFVLYGISWKYWWYLCCVVSDRQWCDSCGIMIDENNSWNRFMMMLTNGELEARFRVVRVEDSNDIFNLIINITNMNNFYVDATLCSFVGEWVFHVGADPFRKRKLFSQRRSQQRFFFLTVIANAKLSCHRKPRKKLGKEKRRKKTQIRWWLFIMCYIDLGHCGCTRRWMQRFEIAYDDIDSKLLGGGPRLFRPLAIQQYQCGGHATTMSRTHECVPSDGRVQFGFVSHFSMFQVESIQSRPAYAKYQVVQLGLSTCTYC